MKNVYLLFYFVSFCFLLACEEPVAEVTEQSLSVQEEIQKLGKVDFTVDNTDQTLLEKDELLITNNSVNAVSYHWDFGNGDTSSEANPNYKYDIHGYYTISLKITDAHGNSYESSKEILVLCLFGGGAHDV